MQHFLPGIYLVITLFFLPVCLVSGEDSGILKRKIYVFFENVTVEEALKELSEKYEFSFAYNPALLPTGKISLREGLLTLENVLGELLPAENYDIEEYDRQIIISLIEGEPFFYKGRLIDKSSGKPVMYGTVSVMGSSVGTISNSDGFFVLKIPERLAEKFITISCLGYRRTHISPGSIAENSTIKLEPYSYKLQEVSVRPLSPAKILKDIRSNIEKNYSGQFVHMDAFYRETLQMNGRYVGVWEAILNVLKSPAYGYGKDRVKFVKGRKSDFNRDDYGIVMKLQGGPWYITRLDVVKHIESFLDADKEYLYRYRFGKAVIFDGRVSWLINFKRRVYNDFPCFEGYIIVDIETSALVMAKFSPDRKSLKLENYSFIRKQPGKVSTIVSNAEYIVRYRLLNGRWHIHTAKMDVSFTVRKKKERFKAEYRSVSDLMITSQYPFPRRAKFSGDGIFHSDDIFSEIITGYDPGFWGDYNIIAPDEDLKNAIKCNVR